MSRFPWRDTSEDIAGQSGSQWETPGGAQEKADKAEENAEKYSDDQLAQHVAVGTHPAENIIESTSRRFASDAKIAFWDNKADGTLVTQTTKGMMSPEDKAKLDKSTNGMTPDTLMLRDAGGRAKVAAPSASNDIARKQEVDEVQANLNVHTGNADIHTSAAEHAKLAGIQAGAQVNQNAFAKINDILAAAIQDGLTIKGGTGITITTNPITKELMITATGSATPGPHASSHITGGTDVISNAVIDGNSGLMSGADAAFVRRDGETKTGAQAKADAAKETAMSYTDEVLGDLTPGSIGAETPAGAQAKADAAKTAAISAAATDASTKASTAESNANAHSDGLVGMLSNLLTTNKSNAVAAINELFTNANSLKSDWAGVIGSPLASTDTSAQLKSKTQSIKDSMATNLTAKGQSSTGSEGLQSLVNKIGQIQTLPTSLKSITTSRLTTLTGTIPNLSIKPLAVVFRLSWYSQYYTGSSVYSYSSGDTYLVGYVGTSGTQILPPSNADGHSGSYASSSAGMTLTASSFSTNSINYTITLSSEIYSWEIPSATILGV